MILSPNLKPFKTLGTCLAIAELEDTGLQYTKSCQVCNPRAANPQTLHPGMPALVGGNAMPSSGLSGVEFRKTQNLNSKQTLVSGFSP